MNAKDSIQGDYDLDDFDHFNEYFDQHFNTLPLFCEKKITDFFIPVCNTKKLQQTKITDLFKLCREIKQPAELSWKQPNIFSDGYANAILSIG